MYKRENENEMTVSRCRGRTSQYVHIKDANVNTLATHAHLLREAFHETVIKLAVRIQLTMIYCDTLMIFHANHLIPEQEGKLLLSIISTVM